MSELNQSDWIALISILLSAIAVISAPVIALYVGGKLDQRRERRRLKLAVFGTLLQTRHDPISAEAVKQMNLIDLIFADDHSVRDAWSQYFTVLSDSRLENETGFAVREDKKNQLLRIMANSMGYSQAISNADLLRTYRPIAEFERQALDMYARRIHLQDATVEWNRRNAPGTPSPSLPEKGAPH